jgi:uncharacterized protein
MHPPSPVAGPRELFERLMRCLLADDREQQLALYSEDCVWEFPFAAGDRPSRMIGREAVRRAMTPLWDQARRAGARVSGFEPLAIHETSDPEVIVAEFHLQVEVMGKSQRLPFVQVLRARGGKLVEHREYFNPQVRTRLLEAEPS